jgi:hypothetical protein
VAMGALTRFHPDLPKPHLALVQVLAVAWLMTGQSLWWPAPRGWPFAWSVALGLVSTALCVALLFTRFTRTASALLASLILLEWALVPTFFAHNRLFVAALLAAVACTSSRFTFLPRWQVALVSGAAALDKLWAPAWLDGRFCSSFFAELSRFGLMWSPGGHVGAPNPLAAWLAEHGTPARWTAAGWSVIALELLLALAFLFRWRFAAWLNVLFHVGVFSLTGSTMGQFFFAGVAASLLLLDDDETPPVAGLLLTTFVLAGPWTHRALPGVALVLLVLWRLSVSRRGRPSR